MQHIEKSHFSPLLPVCCYRSSAHKSFSIFLLSIDYLYSGPLLYSKQGFSHPCCWALAACTRNNKQQDFWPCLDSSWAFVDRDTTRRRREKKTLSTIVGSRGGEAVATNVSARAEAVLGDTPTISTLEGQNSQPSVQFTKPNCLCLWGFIGSRGQQADGTERNASYRKLLFVSDNKMSVYIRKQQQSRHSKTFLLPDHCLLKSENSSISITTSKDTLFLPDFLEIGETKHEVIEETMFEFSGFNCEV